jgi:hypothetical protein
MNHLFLLANGVALPPSESSQLPLVLSALGIIGVVAVATRRKLREGGSRKWIALGLPVLLLAAGIGYGTTRTVQELMLKKRMYDTMDTISRIAEAYEYYQVDTGYGLTADVGRAQFKTAGPGWNIPTGEKLPFAYRLEQLRPLLVPKYIRDEDFRAVDAWGHQFAFAAGAPLPETRASYAIRSGGANGKFDDPILARSEFMPSWDVDIVLYNGQELNYGMWVRHQSWMNPHESIVPFANRAAALVAKRGPSCKAVTTDWYHGDFFFAFVIGPDGRMLCHPDASVVGSQASKAMLDAAGGSGGHGWVKIQSKKNTGTYVTRVTGPDGKHYIVGGHYYLDSP